MNYILDVFQCETDLVALQKEQGLWIRREQDIESAMKQASDELAQLRKEALTTVNINNKNTHLEHQNQGSF